MGYPNAFGMFWTILLSKMARTPEVCWVDHPVMEGDPMLTHGAVAMGQKLPVHFGSLGYQAEMTQSAKLRTDHPHVYYDLTPHVT